MVGYGANRGIVPITCEEIFNRIKASTDPNRSTLIELSLFSI
jgi:kinesin family protein 1